MICRCDSFGVNHTRKRVFKLIIIFEVKCFRGGGGEGNDSKMEQTMFRLDVHCNQNKITKFQLID